MLEFFDPLLDGGGRTRCGLPGIGSATRSARRWRRVDLVVGPNGSGKTAFVEHFLARHLPSRCL